MSCFEHFLVVSGCVSTSAFASLVGIPVGIGSSALGLKIYEITAGIKIYLSELPRKKKEGR